MVIIGIDPLWFLLRLFLFDFCFQKGLEVVFLGFEGVDLIISPLLQYLLFQIYGRTDYILLDGDILGFTKELESPTLKAFTHHPNLMDHLRDTIILL